MAQVERRRVGMGCNSWRSSLADLNEKRRRHGGQDLGGRRNHKAKGQIDHRFSGPLETRGIPFRIDQDFRGVRDWCQ